MSYHLPGASSRGDSWATGPDIDLLNLDRVLELNCAYLAVLSLAEEGAAILPLQQKPAPIFSAWANGPSGKSVLGCGEFWYFQQVANPSSCWLLYVATDSELIETGRCHYCSREPAIFGRQRIATLRPKAYESPRHFVCVCVCQEKLSSPMHLRGGMSSQWGRSTLPIKMQHGTPEQPQTFSFKASSESWLERFEARSDG